MKYLLLSALTFLSLSTYASDPYYEISAVVSEELVDDYQLSPLGGQSLASDRSKSDIQTIIAAVDNIIALGEIIYKVVEKGRAVVDLAYQPMDFLPTDDGEIVRPFSLENWAMPKSKKYRIKFINKLKMVVVDFIYSVNINYGGQFQGKGQYLSGVQIVPELVDVSWGFNFDAAFSLITLVNHGTKDDPNVGATLLLEYSVDNVITNIQKKISFHVTGGGEIKKI